ncbi:hypothetical protein KKG52_03905, partial [Patescibacteria group bacterium]|nr:hypothetical protein [Patescibacteria group bacterium]
KFYRQKWTSKQSCFDTWATKDPPNMKGKNPFFTKDCSCSLGDTNYTLAGRTLNDPRGYYKCVNSACAKVGVNACGGNNQNGCTKAKDGQACGVTPTPTTTTTTPVTGDRCTAISGKKINTVTQVCSGSVLNGYYPNNPWNIKCCKGTVKAKTSLDRCALAGGQKVNISTQYCSGSILNNYYPNDPWDIKCCKGNITNKPSTCTQRYPGAVCQYDSNPCGTSYLTGLCPGGTRIRCCRSPL